TGLPRRRTIGCMTDLVGLVRGHQRGRIVLGVRERLGRIPFNDLLDLRFAGVRVEDALTTYETAFGRVPVRELRPSQLIFSADLGPRAKKVFWQSIYSFAIAVIATIVMAPIMLLVAILIKLAS